MDNALQCLLLRNLPPSQSLIIMNRPSIRPLQRQRDQQEKQMLQLKHNSAQTPLYKQGFNRFRFASKHEFTKLELKLGHSSCSNRPGLYVTRLRKTLVVENNVQHVALIIN